MTRPVRHEARRSRLHSTLEVRSSKAGLHELWSSGRFAQAPRATGGARPVPPLSSAPSAQYLAMLRPYVAPLAQRSPYTLLPASLALTHFLSQPSLTSLPIPPIDPSNLYP